MSWFSSLSIFSLVFVGSLFAKVTQKEGSGMEKQTILYNLPEENNAFPKMEGWLDDLDEAIKLSAESHKPLLIAFTGSNWCPWSLKLAREVLSTQDFIRSVKEEMVLVWVDFPENSLESQAEKQKIKEKYKVGEIPMLVVSYPSGEEVFKVGYMPQPPLEFASSLKKHLHGYNELKEEIAKSDLAALSGEELKALYLKARNLGCNAFKEQILEIGLQENKEPFFLLEKYARFVESGLKKDKMALALREKIENIDSKNDSGSLLQLAVLDFQDNSSHARKIKEPKSAIKPLVRYIEKYGKKDPENLWKVEMMIAQFLFSKNKIGDALAHAKASYEAAPDAMKSEIAQSVDYLQTQLAVQ